MKQSANPFLLFVLFAFSFLSISEEALAQKMFTIVIDPGHGGKDSGALGTHEKEKNISLGVGLKLGQMIEKKHPDVKVIYTRKSDVFVELNKRASIANKAHADLFISLHCNSVPKKRVAPQGVETYVLGLHRSKDNLDVAKTENSVILFEEDYSQKYKGFDPKQAESYIIFEFMSDQFLKQSVYFASLVQNNLIKYSGRINRSVRQAGFLVLREVAMPSILIEMGYISNSSDEQYLKSSSGQTSIANSVYKAFCEYKHEYDKKNSNNKNDNSKNRKQQTTTVTEGKTAAEVHIEEKNTKTDDSVTNSVEYSIQILVSKTIINKNSPKFKGLQNVDYYKDGDNYKYFYGKSSDLNEIIKQLKQVQQLFKDAFIIKFKNGIRTE